jgi:2'-deoxynucleoside 5'-phosphate N-hydrolase
MLYFAAAIRGSRTDVGIYARMIDELRSVGHVLTEHVVSPEKTEHSLSDKKIYLRDMSWLDASEAVIAEVSQPSIGVGYELGRAQFLGKPVLCLYRTGSATELSAMVSGNEAFQVHNYTDVADAAAQIRHWLSSLNLA